MHHFIRFTDSVTVLHCLCATFFATSFANVQPANTQRLARRLTVRRSVNLAPRKYQANPDSLRIPAEMLMANAHGQCSLSIQKAHSPAKEMGR